MRVVMITGGCGFIGQNLVRHWTVTYPDDQVIIVDKMTYAATLTDLATLGPNVTVKTLDIRATETLETIMRECGVTHIINLAAETHNSRAIDDPVLFFDTNTDGVVSLLQACRENPTIQRVHLVSTCEVYGALPDSAQAGFKPGDPYQPTTPYAASKAAGDLAGLAWHRTYRLPVSISNCANNYGPWQHPEKLIPLVITSALTGARVPVFSDLPARREWLHVEDHCRALEEILLWGQPGRVYHIGGGVERELGQVVDLILGQLGFSWEDAVQFVPDRPGHDRRYLLDSHATMWELGWAPRVPFGSGLANTVEWYRAHLDWWAPLLGTVPPAHWPGIGKRDSR